LEVRVIPDRIIEQGTLTTDGTRAAVEVRLPWYRALPASCIAGATLTVDGDPECPRDLPAAVDRTGYRIVQESLTNISRHAAPTTASVRIGYRPGTLVIHVEDDGIAGTASPGAAPVPGVGLTGMRERVTALGGRLLAEPRAEGGFTVHAELPVDRTP